MNRIRAAAVLCLLSVALGLSSIEARAGTENEFYRELVKKPVASQSDLIRAAARMKGYRGPDRTEEELGYLDDLGVRFPKGILRRWREPVTKGEAAKVILNAMRSSADQRGIFGRLFTGSRRLAARDAMAQKILPSGSYANEFMSGAELMAMLGRAVEQMGKSNE